MDIKFSPKELDVLNECNIDALIKRALPLGHGMASLCWLGHEKGFLKVSSSQCLCRLTVVNLKSVI